eukprot:CAMPEP_0184691938 /NCGR_PEP_ID=MMETSP0313-20130426/621_1 /TAXON_ID=2792 /ORGANISM="Porphyridium aerugineum, Strain SAG 1380-2" /LENGTH=214 /DNA_ID=CAMNT_0027149721 /DNA_START=272 /DNA_END=916 /DNA_ORIENTATION=-
MTVSSGVEQKIRVTGNNVDLTDSLRNYVIGKIGKAIAKYDNMVVHVDVHLEVKKNPSIRHPHSVEVVCQVKGNVLRAEVKSENMYTSIDTVEDKMSRVLRKYKERHHQVHGGEKIGDLMEQDVAPLFTPAKDSDFEEFGLEIPPYEDENGVPRVRQVLKKKSFPMPPQTVEEAVLCLEYIGHDFYVFQNKDTKQINVVYKRNNGNGVGLIEPKL